MISGGSSIAGLALRESPMGAVEDLVAGLLPFDDTGGAPVSDQEKEEGGCDAFDEPAAVEAG
jgi:hypothetical protein